MAARERRVQPKRETARAKYEFLMEFPLEVRKEVRDVIVRHYAGMQRAVESLDRTIQTEYQ